jgi:uncharacterized membrane-anchored protein
VYGVVRTVASALNCSYVYLIIYPYYYNSKITSCRCSGVIFKLTKSSVLIVNAVTFKLHTSTLP